MAGYGDNKDRSYVYELRPSVPYWRQRFTYLTSGDFSIQLEPGKYQISVTRGNEYIPVSAELEIGGGEARVQKKYLLKRWINLPEEGWYSGDVHVHHPTSRHEFREFLLHYAIAEDLHVTNVLAMGHHGGVAFDQAGFGKEYRIQRGDYALVSGQEDPRSSFGHIIGLNVRRMVRDVKQYDLFDLAFQAIHEQGGLVGYAHFAWNGANQPKGFPWYINTGLIDFVELLQFRHLNALDYYDYLNLGFKLTAAAGSGVPWGSTIGEVRTFVYIGSEFNLDLWFDGLKKGHTFVSNGPALDFTVDKKLPGSEIHLPKGHVSRINVSVRSHPDIGLPKHLRVIGSDGIIGEFLPEGTGDPNISRALTFKVDRSQWMVASTVCDNGAVAHTTPICLIVEDQPFYNLEKAPILIDRQTAIIDSIKTEAEDWPDDPRTSGILKRLNKAVQFYSNLKQTIQSKADQP